MRHTTFLVVLLLCLPQAALAETNVFQDAGKRLALVIGIAAYDHAQPLRNPVKDARIMAKALGDQRFEVIAVENPTHAALVAARKEFLSRLEGADIALLYYAGHAIQIEGANYIVPADAALSPGASVFDEVINVASIANAMDLRAKTKIIVLDACRDNPFEKQLAGALAHSGGERKFGRGLAPIRQPSTLNKPEGEGFNTYGSIIAFAAAPGETATDGEGDNSPYTAALAAELTKPGIEVGQMFRTAAANVIRETTGKQRPEHLVRLTDEVYFSRPQPSDCDYFAVAPYNQVGIPGIEFDAIRPAKAIAACEEALASDPQHPRFLHNLGRAYDAAGSYDEAVDYYRRSSDLGYTPAINTLGVMHINGQGTAQNFEEGVRLLKRAARLGYRLSKVALRNQDFTRLFSRDEYRSLQTALQREGFYKGPIDGEFGAGSKAALKIYQKARGLAPAGGTLETLDSLSLLSIIPSYELN